MKTHSVLLLSAALLSVGYVAHAKQSSETKNPNKPITSASLLDTIYSVEVSKEDGSDFIDQTANSSNPTWYWNKQANGASQPLMALDAEGRLAFFSPEDPLNPVIIIDPNGPAPSISVGGKSVLLESINDVSATISANTSKSLLQSNGVAALMSTTTLTGNTSLGSGASATANYSTSIGYLSQATAEFANTLGHDSRATGSKSSAYGAWANATGSYSIAIGSSAVGSGDYSASFGASAKASGLGAISSGSVSTASGDYSTASGYFANATNKGTLAIGYSAIASDEYASAIGPLAKADKSNALAIGRGSKAIGLSSIAIGNSSEASGDYSYTTGSFSTTTAQFANAYGHDAHATGVQSIAIGTWANAIGTHAVAIGTRTTAKERQIALGAFNKPEDATTVLFMLANGTDTNSTSNAVTVTHEGKMTIYNKQYITPAPLTNPSPAQPDSLEVQGNAVINGKITLKQPAGDVSMGGFVANP